MSSCNSWHHLGLLHAALTLHRANVLAETSVWAPGLGSAGIPVADAASLGPGVCSVLVGVPWEYVSSRH